MWTAILIGIYCVAVILASLLGGWLPTFFRLTHTRIQMMMSFVGGLMMGVALLHLLPHAAVAMRSINGASLAAVGGLLATFFLIRAFHVHHHGAAGLDEGQQHAIHPHHDEVCGHPVAISPDAGSPAAPDHDHDHHAHHDHDHAHHDHAHHDHDPKHEHAQDGAHRTDSGDGPRRLRWMGLAAGLGLHTLIDGVAMAASVAMEASESTTFQLVGLGTFLAVFLHKPLDALSLTSLMIAEGWSRKATLWVNLGFALMCPFGAVVFFLGVREWTDPQQLAVGIVLGLAAGVFLCISLSDLLPEIQFHAHDRIKLSAALVAGVLMAYAIGFFEPEHAHDFPDGGHGHGHSHQHDH